MTTVRFTNESHAPIDLQVEPWGAIETIPAGVEFAIHYEPPADRPDTSVAQYHRWGISFWVEGDSYELDIDGVRIPT